ncbi:MAG: AgmX/PglI C-terminal domain-containing protein [Deltaproteobacteria bacterium]|nr:AgmX/PglI C-terminal domain-containing protein [Deltaproteobacteria bacterium]
MFVLQIFVMRNGALESVEMACGDRIVVGQGHADVPIAGAGASVALTLDGERIIATPMAAAVRVDGEVATGPVTVSAASELWLGDVSVKVRRPVVARATPPAVELGGGADGALAVTVAEATAPLPITVPEEHVAAAATLPFAAFVDDDEVADDDDEPDWSLVEALARPAEGTKGPLVEVLQSAGERVLEHTLLDGDAAFLLDGRALVRRRARGGCELLLPPGAAARCRRGGELTDVLAGPTPLTMTLEPGDAATVRAGDAVLLVRFAARPRTVASAAERLAARAEQRVQAWCASAGLALSGAFATTLWLLEYRDRELAVPLDNDDITQWPDVILEMKEPLRPVERHDEPMPTEEPAPTKAPRAASPKRPAQAAAAKPTTVLDIAATLPVIKTNRAVDAARENMRAPLPGRPGGLIIGAQIARGPGAGSTIGGSGLSTMAGTKGLAAGAGSMTQGEARAIGGTVKRGQLKDLKLPEEQGLSREQILKVINANVGQIQGCYERGLRDDPSIAGRVQVAWTIAPTGEVTGTRVQTSTLGAPTVERCILDKIELWRFPASKGRSQVVFPFSFAAL